MKIAIMQPTYLPWVGYFAMIASVDLFVILDDVQFARRSWQQRNRIKSANGELWLTVPVASKNNRDQLINQVKIVEEQQPLLKHAKTIETCYKKSKHYDEYAKALFDIYHIQNSSLCRLNTDIICWLNSCFKINTPIVNSSTLPAHGAKGDRLVSICKALNATKYIAAPASENYLSESDSFERAGIELEYFNYKPLPYTQLYGDYLPYLSAIDLLFNEGINSFPILINGVNQLNYHEANS